MFGRETTNNCSHSMSALWALQTMPSPLQIGILARYTMRRQP
jgi:hypothetical protein